MARRIEVQIVGDAAQLEKAFGRAGKETSGFGNAINKASLGAAAALGALGLAAKAGFSEFMEGERVSAQTAAAITSTGGAANVTKGQIESLAGSLSRMSGVDDEVIQSGQNMLLTFKNIQNTVGAGNDIFDQATKATLDLSVALGKDMSSSALMVGKALNDPIAGLTALTRAGVQFSDEQKTMIRSLDAAGDKLGAQKIILKELESQFGGSAKAAGGTFAGQVNKAKNAASEMAAGLVSATVPALVSMSGAVSAAAGFLQKHEGATRIAIIAVAGLAAGVLVVNATMKVYSATMAVVSAATTLWSARMAIAATTTRLWTGAQLLLNAALIANPIGVVIAALVLLGAGLVIAYQRSQTFRDVVTGAFNAVRNAALTAVGLILSGIEKFLGGIESMVRAMSKLPFIGDKFKGLADKVGSARDSVRALQGSIDNLKSKSITVTTTLVTVHKTYHETYRVPGEAGSRASGGPVGMGKPYLVGEKGPEIFVPNASGKIIPNNKLSTSSARGGAAGVQNFYFPNYVGNQRELVDAVRTEVRRATARNG